MKMLDGTLKYIQKKVEHGEHMSPYMYCIKTFQISQIKIIHSPEIKKN